jgi:hypothetical protein
MQVRALTSASDSSKAWDLRCYVREKLIQFLQDRYPESLPKVRAEMSGFPTNNHNREALPMPDSHVVSHDPLSAH